MSMVCNKLVRDKIPAIINAQGKKANTRILNDAEYLRALEVKLDEEVSEYHKDRNLEELADILEVIYALTESSGHSMEELLEACEKKRQERGGFRDRVFLISNEG